MKKGKIMIDIDKMKEEYPKYDELLEIIMKEINSNNARNQIITDEINSINSRVRVLEKQLSEIFINSGNNND